MNERVKAKHISVRLTEGQAEYIKRAAITCPKQSVNTFILEAAILSAGKKLKKRRTL